MKLLKAHTGSLPTLVIVTGPPASGKTYLLKQIRTQLNLPIISRDFFKERLLDVVGWSDRESVTNIGTASYDIVYHVARELLRTGNSLIIESNFKPKWANAQFEELLTKVKCKVLQVYITAADQVLLERFAARSYESDRHPGYLDKSNIEEVQRALANKEYYPLEIPGELIEVDNTDPRKVNSEEVVERIGSALGA